MIKLLCDVCEKTIEVGHKFMGNISRFNVEHTCDTCWDELNKARDEIEGLEKNAAESVDEGVAAILARVKASCLKG